MFRRELKTACLVASMALMIFPCGRVETASAQSSLGDLTGSWQLLVDDYLVSEKSNLERTYHQFGKQNSGNPVMVGDQPWEGEFIYLYGTVLPGETGDGYRMWYHGYSGGKYQNLYATSDDGINWVKPNLGIVEYGGSTNNNLFFDSGPAGRNLHLPQVIHTPWEADPNRRYKLVGFDYDMNGYRGATSPDGIHWTDVPDNPVLPDPGDVGNFVWDARDQRYLGTPKIWTTVRGVNRRCVGVSFTEDFENWPSPRLSLVPDEIDDHWATGSQRTDFYGLSAFAYESGYLGFLWVFQITDGGNDGPIYPELVSSHDGIHWTRQEPGAEGGRAPLLELGAAGTWDDGMICTPNHPLVEGDTIKLFYGGIDDTHGYPNKPAHSAIGLATMRKDGFASLDAGATDGLVTTKLLENMGGPLLVNANAAGGWLKAEVLDAQGNVIPGYGLDDCTPISADGVSLPVSWGALTDLPVSEEPMQLRFALNSTSLYSFMAGQDVGLPETPPIPPTGTFDRSGVLFTFEGDTNQWITDKLITDGSQDPYIHGDVSVVDDSAQAAFGDRSASFPDSPNTATLLEIPETSNLGKAFTLAVMIDETGENFSRLFSAYNGSTAGNDELIFDIDPSGTTFPGVRAIIHGAYVLRDAQFDDDQYHHLALTYNDGKVRLYLDGVQLGDEELVPDGVVELAYDLHFGEDYTPTSQINEPFEGRVDDILVYRRPFAPSQIQALAQNGAEFFFSVPHGIGYTAEGDSTSATDTLIHDGAQNGVFRGAVQVDGNPANARVGDSSFELAADPDLSTIEMVDSSYLGDAFTLASFVNVTGDGHTRLFSAYDGSGEVLSDELLLDFAPDGAQVNGLCAIVNGTTVMPDEPVSFATGEYHHLAMTYDDGLVRLFLDGQQVADGEVGSGAIALARNLLFGEDWGGVANEQFLGHADEILLLFEALSPGDVFQLAHPDLLPGDANGDGVVDDQDASILAAHWQQTGMSWGDGDFNGDEVVNDQDASILAAHWQETTEGTTSVPEPGPIVLLLGGLLSLLLWRRK